MFGKKMIKKNFQSELDTFFHDFDKQRQSFPESRLEEVKKHQAIANKRDNPVEEQKSEIWEGF